MRMRIRELKLRARQVSRQKKKVRRSRTDRSDVLAMYKVVCDALLRTRGIEITWGGRTGTQLVLRPLTFFERVRIMLFGMGSGVAG